MGERINLFFRQVSVIWKNIPPSARVVIPMVALLIMAGFGYIIYATNTMDYQYLFSNMDQKDAGQVVEKLNDLKVPYQLEAGGSAILVPAGKLYDVRIKLASAGLPKGGGSGFELFDQSYIGMTDFMQKLNYRRALQGELSRTINSIDGISSSRVHVVIPEKSLFKEDQLEPSASVILEFNKSFSLNKSQIQGIKHLVASSVEGLAANNITIVDNNGQVLSKPSDEQFAMGGGSTIMEYQRNYERNLEEKVRRMLEKVMGPGKAVVQITAEMNFSKVEQTEEIYDPENQVARSEQNTTESSRSKTPMPGGVPGSQSNIPVGEGVADDKNSTIDSNRNSLVTNYEINKVIKHTVVPVGTLKKISVATMVDGIYQEKEGATQYAKRSAKEIKELESIVMKAVGFDQQRGDQIEVSCVQFHQIKDDGKEPFLTPHLVRQLLQGGKFLIYLLMTLLLVFFIMRPMVRWVTTIAPPIPVDYDGVRRAAALASGEVEEDQETKTLDATMEEQRLLLEAQKDARRKVQDFAKENAAQTAQILKSWLKEKPA